MKYLRLVDHLGREIMKLGVFVDGRNFEWEADKPMAIWLGKIQLLDKIPEEELGLKPEGFLIDTVTSKISDLIKPEPEPELPVVNIGPIEMPEEIGEVKRKCTKCGWEGTQKECGFGHHDFYCPICCVESFEPVKIEEVESESRLELMKEEAEAFFEQKEEKSEPERICDTSSGDEGVGASEHLESVEELPQDDKGDGTAKRGKRPRKRKAT